MCNEQEEEITLPQVKQAIKDFHAKVESIEVERLRLWHEELYAWGRLQAILNKNITLITNE